LKIKPGKPQTKSKTRNFGKNLPSEAVKQQHQQQQQLKRNSKSNVARSGGKGEAVKE